MSTRPVTTSKADPGHAASAEPWVPAHERSLQRLAAAARDCQGCELYRDAIQTVFGSGPASASIMLVGEQPGDQEDKEGEPFIGPAGHILDRALEEVGIDRGSVYVTNAVKHFRFKSTESSQRRIHRKPSVSQMRACAPWLAAELEAVRPEVLVALGATAAAALFGPRFRLTEHRGERLPWPPPAGEYAGSRQQIGTVLATIHPSAVLRAGDGRAEAMAGLIADLRLAASTS